MDNDNVSSKALKQNITNNSDSSSSSKKSKRNIKNRKNRKQSNENQEKKNSKCEILEVELSRDKMDILEIFLHFFQKLFPEIRKELVTNNMHEDNIIDVIDKHVNNLSDFDKDLLGVIKYNLCDFIYKQIFLWVYGHGDKPNV